jgi:hypothetical protein
VIFDTIEVRIELEAAAFAKDLDTKPLNQQNRACNDRSRIDDARSLRNHIP